MRSLRTQSGACAGAASRRRAALDPVGVALERQRPVAQVRQHVRRDARVVVDHLALGEADCGIQDLVEVGERQAAAADVDVDAVARRHRRAALKHGSKTLVLKQLDEAHALESRARLQPDRPPRHDDRARLPQDPPAPPQGDQGPGRGDRQAPRRPRLGRRAWHPVDHRRPGPRRRRPGPRPLQGPARRAAHDQPAGADAQERQGRVRHGGARDRDLRRRSRPPRSPPATRRPPSSPSRTASRRSACSPTCASRSPCLAKQTFEDRTGETAGGGGMSRPLHAGHARPAAGRPRLPHRPGRPDPGPRHPRRPRGGPDADAAGRPAASPPPDAGPRTASRPPRPRSARGPGRPRDRRAGAGRRARRPAGGSSAPPGPPRRRSPPGR